MRAVSSPFGPTKRALAASNSGRAESDERVASAPASRGASPTMDGAPAAVEVWLLPECGDAAFQVYAISLRERASLLQAAAAALAWIGDS